MLGLRKNEVNRMYVNTDLANKDIRLIAFDLDGTLLNSDKVLTPRNREALERAAEKGILIVPTTGRLFKGIPSEIRQFPFLRYAVTINGAAVFDTETGDNLYRAEIPPEKAIEIMTYLDQFPVIYDCYKDNTGWMTQSMWDQAEIFAPNAYYVHSIRTNRKPVPELKEFLRQQGGSVQKIQLFSTDPELRTSLLREIPLRFSHLAVSSSVSRNVEINHENAHKGAALLALASHLGLDRSQVMAFGDGLNDISMIREAGIGVAMENAVEEVKAVADLITGSCEESGVADVIEQLL